MEHYARIGCIGERDQRVCDRWGRQDDPRVKVPSEPDALLAALMEDAFTIQRVGLEAGPFSQWLYGALAEAGLPVICVETRHMKAALSAQIQQERSQ